MGFVTDVEQWADRVIADPQWTADCLQRLYRFGGQHPESTVLRHSVHVWHLCKDLSPQEQIWALVHDAHEILSGEIPREFKCEFTKRKQEEADAILKAKLGLKWIDTTRVHTADILHGAQEFQSLNKYLAGEFNSIRFASENYCCAWYAAPAEFVYQFEKLKAEI